MYLALIKGFLIAKKEWIKYALIAILTVSVLAYVYSAGKHSERSEWLEQEQEFLAKQSAIKEENDKRIKENRENYDRILLGVISNHEKEQKNLNDRIAELSNKRLYITAAKNSGCDRVPTETKSTGEFDSPPDRIELSRKDGENIRNDYGTAQRLVEQYENLRAVCLPLVEVVE